MIRQKIMGAFYLLKQSGEEVSLHQVMAVALEEKKSRVFSVYTCFEDLIGKMVKSKGNGTTHSNIQKHQVCLRYLRAFVTREYGWNDFPFDRINRSLYTLL